MVGDERDAAEAVKFVTKPGHDDDINLSVRSGGHSYGCTSSKVVNIKCDWFDVCQCSLMDYNWT